MSELIKFKAGRVQYDEETGQATPLRGQGNVVLKRSSEDDSLLAIQWLPRAAYGQSLQPTEELMVLPGDVTFEHIKECKTGRVISLRFESSGRREMYWLQDPVSGDLNELSDADRHNLERLNELANQELDEEDEESLSEPVAVAPQATAATTQSTAGAPAGVSAPSVPSMTGPASLSRALNSNRLTAHITNASQEEIDELLATVSPLATSRSELVELVRSPHFQGALNQLDEILLQGGTQGLSAELGVPYEGEGVVSFLNAIRKQFSK